MDLSTISLKVWGISCNPCTTEAVVQKSWEAPISLAIFLLLNDLK